MWGIQKWGGEEREQSTKKSTAKTKQPPQQQKNKTEREKKKEKKKPHKKIKWGEKGKRKKKNNFKWKKGKGKEKEERKMPQNKARLNRTRSGGCVEGGLGLLERKDSPFGVDRHTQSSEQLALGARNGEQKQNKTLVPHCFRNFKNVYRNHRVRNCPLTLAAGNAEYPWLWLNSI